MNRIVIIDDNSAHRTIAAQALRHHGFEVVEAADGKSGLEAVRRDRPDLILSDIHMAGLNGLELLSHVRSHVETATIPVVLMTGQADLAGLRKGMLLGADDYLPKPFTASELAAAVTTQLEKHRALRREAEERLHEFQASITLMLPHELLTPLNGILGFAQLLQSDGPNLTAQQIREFSEGILESGLRLHRLIQNFLIYAQIETLAGDPDRAAELRRHVVPDPRTLIEEITLAHAARHARQEDLRLHLGAVPVPLPVDALRKIVEELIDNALKFSPPGTPIEVRLEPDSPGPALMIQDRGHGMTSAQVASVAAYRQFNRRLRAQDGTGLGLAIARGLAELHGGRLVIESESRRGTRVRVLLPPGSMS